MGFSPAAVVSNIRRIFLVIGVSALCGILMAGLALPVVGALGLGARESSDWFREMELDFEPGELSETSRIRDADGKILARFFDENRHYVELDKISENMVDAILAIEDDRFFERGPIDFQGTLRALARNVEAGETQGGGSTLTQQYVKQVRLSQAESSEERASVLASEGIDGYKRKLDELRMAISVEQEYSKEEILERYLNIAYFGSRAYGVEAAARTYFSTSAEKLTVTQAAMLAGIVQSPNQYDPNRNPEAALGRRNVVLGRMAETGKISEADAAEARQTDLNLDPTSISNGCVDSSAGFFCDYVVNEIRQMEELGDTPEEREHALYNGGLTIETTLDRDVQKAADKAVSERVAPTDTAVGSLASVEPETGHIKALANSRKYGVEGEGVSNINYAVNRNMGGSVGMQPGSAAKAWFLAAAINQGISLNTRFSSPAQISIPQNQFRDCDGPYPVSAPWEPKNYDGPRGNINLPEATEGSVNTYYAQLAVQTGLCEPAMLAEAMGAGRADGKDYEVMPAMVLGTNETSPLGMAQAYGTFANRGRHCEPTAVLRVKDKNGDVLVDRTEPNCERVLEKPVADAINSVLEGVIHNSGGTGGRMQLDDGRRAAGKTGTTNDAIAVWFVGYTPQLATAVSVADVDGDPDNGGQLRSLHGMSFNGEVVANACGGCLPGPVWKQFMDDVLDDEPKKDFKKPDGSVIQGISLTVPDVRGMSSDQAISTLQDEGFSATVAERIQSDLPEGRVVRTNPGAGSQAPSGTTIRLSVSNGVPPGQNDDDDDDDDDNRFRIPEDREPRLPNDNNGGDNGNNGNNDDDDDDDNGGWD
ncbi:PASTA domain-containing protein [Phytoactinopolyspora alkaliphila]|uniref:PASTA domain-containing protein n=1 Tax=Phytoactinopolyspora alkaliphila TaxID=1783498 RepID=A0A6N9YLK8_9ACTN|nr:transglycosylase domain-containing protein [Phytoactinopolyspora alkaliphila]NED95832.1 PASTA domain-containing protein [Phytoactinopolyspora alkaliphila]